MSDTATVRAAAPNARRSLLLFALGGIVGLAIAGYGLFTARGTRLSGVPPQDLALVNQRPILRSDFMTQVQTTYGVRFAEATPAQLRQVREDMINEELMVQRGLEIDLPSYDPEVRSALVAGVELELFANVLAQRPSEAQLQTYYDSHRSKYVRDGVMRLRDLVLGDGGTLATARAAVQALRAGAPLDAVMARYHLSDSRRLLDSGHVDLGQVFEFAARARLDPAVFAAARALPSGTVSDPIEARDGVHIVVMNEHVLPVQRPFSEVENEVWRDLGEDAKRRVREATLRYLRSRADIQLGRMP